MSELDDMRLKDQVKKMKAARKMVLAFTDLVEGRHSFSRDGWLDFYTYEPIEYGICQLRNVIKALNTMAEPFQLQWEFRLFGCDRMITTNSDGSMPTFTDESCVAIFEE